MNTSLVALLHLCDSLFPIGSFSHSDGLEAATSSGAIQSSSSLRKWMDATITTTLRRAEAPAVLRGMRAFAIDDFESLTKVDDELFAIRPSSTGRGATRAMGARLVRTWQHVRPSHKLAELLARRDRFTLPVAFGVVSAAAGIAERPAVDGYIYTRLAATVSAAMRLLPIGQHEGHTLLADALTRVPAVTDEVLVDSGQLRCFAPMLDIAAMSQQYGRTRLFRS